MIGERVRGDGDRPDLVPPLDLGRGQLAREPGDLPQRNALRGAGREHVGIGEVRQASPVLEAEPRHDGDLAVTLPVVAHRSSGDGRLGGESHVESADAREIRPVVVDRDVGPQARRAPVVADPGGEGSCPEGVGHLAGDLPQRVDVLSRDPDRDRDSDRLAGLELPDVDPGPRDPGGERRLDRADELLGEVLVRHLDDDLRVVDLLLLRLDGEPEPRAGAADEAGEAAEDVGVLVVLAELVGHLADDALRLDRGLVGGRERWRPPESRRRCRRDTRGPWGRTASSPGT